MSETTQTYESLPQLVDENVEPNDPRVDSFHLSCDLRVYEFRPAQFQIMLDKIFSKGLLELMAYDFLGDSGRTKVYGVRILSDEFFLEAKSKRCREELKVGDKIAIKFQNVACQPGSSDARISE
eukprot:343661_1